MDKRRHKWHTENIHNTSFEINMLRRTHYAEQKSAYKLQRQWGGVRPVVRGSSC